MAVLGVVARGCFSPSNSAARLAVALPARGTLGGHVQRSGSHRLGYYGLYLRFWVCL